MKIFVTGATGFLGSNLTKRLVQEGDEVKILIHKKELHPLLLGLGMREVRGDINDFSLLEEAMSGCDFVYHCAAFVSFSQRDYDKLFAVNVEGTKNVVNAALECGVKKLVYTSACAVFGITKNPTLLDESSFLEVNNGNPYAYSKRLAEKEILKACEKGLDAVIVNPSTIYGQGDTTLNSGLLIKLIYQNRLKFAPPGGTSVVSVDDVVEGHLLAMEKGKKGERYILSNEKFTYFDLFNVIAEVVGTKRIRFKVPSFSFYPAILSAKIMEKWFSSPLINLQILKELSHFKYFNSTKARNELGWNPKVDFKTAVARAFEFYKSQKLL